MPPRLRRTINILFHIPPVFLSCLGVYRLYQATQLDGAPAEEAFVIGLLLLACTVLLVSMRSARRRSFRDDEWESRQDQQDQRLSRIEKEQDAIRGDVHSRLASKTWLEVFDRVEAHKNKGWVHLNRPDR